MHTMLNKVLAFWVSII